MPIHNNPHPTLNKTWNQWLNRFLDYERGGRQASKHTLRAYTKDLELFFQHVQDADVDDVQHISKFHIRSFLSLLYEKGHATSTMKRRLSCLRSFFRYLMRFEILT
ncbi:MAG: site-specific integrase, partial [Myxococcota bacterium]